MSLESCPSCGYALSVSGQQCRHCPPDFIPLRAKGLEMKLLMPLGAAAVGLGLVIYKVFSSRIGRGSADLPVNLAAFRRTDSREPTGKIFRGIQLVHPLWLAGSVA